MAQGRGNRDQKQAAKAVRRQQAVAAKRQVERRVSSLPGRVGVAAKASVERCVRLATTFHLGIGHVILAKRLPSNALGCAFFLVDTSGLGVKDAFYREVAQSEFEKILDDLSGNHQGIVDMDPAAALKLVTESVASAAALKLPPAKTDRTIVRAFGDIDAAGSGATFTFGRDGKPLYMQGPNDTPARIREITRTLRGL